MPALHSADQEQLQKLLLGQLPTADVERLATEYADDGRLAELAESLAGQGDALLDLLHNHETAVVDPEGERLVERLLERLKPALPDKPRDDTAAMRLADASTEPSSPDLNAPPPKLPERLEHYRPIRVLGQGGMGTVYLAEDTRLDRAVAIKTLRADLAINPQFKQRFLREARSAAKLEHDHVIPIYSVGEAADGTPFLAMPLLKGEPLDALIRRTAAPQPVAMVVRLARETALGLAAAHARGLIHRDIKPANIWLEVPTGRVKILDFGLAKAADAGSEADSETHLTASGAIVGTPAYMAPEQASGHAVDGRADLFSLGCVLYELLAGKRAFSGPNTMSILMSLANHTPPAPDKLSPQCPAALSRLVMQLLEKDPTKRPASAEAVIQALDQLDIAPAVVGWALLPVIPNATGKSAHPTNPVLHELAAPPGSPSQVERTQSDMARPIDSSLALPATEVFPVRRQTTRKSRVALALGGLLLMMLAGEVYRIQTDQGTLVVTINDPAVQAILELDGLVIRDKSSDRTWTIKATETKKLLPSGKYQVEGKPNLQLLVTDDSGAEVTTETFVLKRKGEVRLRVTLDQDAKIVGKNGGANKPVVGTGGHGWSADAPPPAIAPFDAEQAKQHQEAWAKYLGVPVEYENSIGMKFVLIPPGEFTMGATDLEIEEQLKEAEHQGRIAEQVKASVRSLAPQHRVRLTKPIYLGIHEVTHRQYETVMGRNPSEFVKGGNGEAAVVGIDTSNFAVDHVSWEDATEFCFKLSKREQLTPFYWRAGETLTTSIRTGYRLPTDAQWEFACRAGTTTNFWNGNRLEDLEKVAWFGKPFGGRPHAVGELLPNPFGLFDTHGNLIEWCEDWWAESYYGSLKDNPVLDPTGPPAGTQRVFRHGFWGGIPAFCGSSMHDKASPSFRNNCVGFRVALPVDAVKRAGNAKQSEHSNSLPATAASDPDRRGAEWVLSMGGWIDVKEGDQEGRFRDVGELPQGAFQLKAVELSMNPNVPDAGLANLKDCRHLTTLNLRSQHISDVGLANFQGCRNLDYLSLQDTRVTDVGLVFFKDCQNLTHLNLTSTKVSDAGLAQFQDCKNLTHLLLTSTQVSDAGLVHFKNCQKLTYLGLAATQVTDAGLVHFKDCQNLTILFLGITQVTDAGLAHFKDCKNLTTLYLAQTQVSDASLDRLADYPKLGLLQITKTKVTEAGVKKLSAALPGCKIEWDGGVIEPRPTDPDRRAAEYVLSVGGTIYINENGQARQPSAIGDLPRGAFELEAVNLSENQKVNDAGLAHFQNCKNLKQLELGGTLVSDVGLAHFQQCQNLTSLGLNGAQVSDLGLAHFQDCKNFTHLYLGGTKVSDAGLVHFKDCKNLKLLHLGNTKVSDAGVAHFKDCKNLMSLDLRNANVSDAGLAHFKGCQNLAVLQLYGPLVTDVGLAHFQDCQNLTQLDLSATQVSDARLAHFAGCPKLGSVIVKNTKVTEAVVKKLSAALPGCKIVWDGGAIEPSSSDKQK